MSGDAASRLPATELCVTLRVTEDFYINPDKGFFQAVYAERRTIPNQHSPAAVGLTLRAVGSA
jgi:hypothetical protein